METLLPIATRIAQLLKARGETVAVAESSAGGLIAASLLAVPGASAYFIAGAVVYTRPARRTLMGLADADVTGIRSSSEPYARLLARTSRLRHNTSWGLAETGASGPTGNSYGDAAGHSCMAVSSAGTDGFEQVMTLETGHGDRVANMRTFARTALEMFEQALAR